MLTTRHGMKWEKQVLAAITTLCGKVAVQWNKSMVMAFSLEEMMDGRWKMFLITRVGQPGKILALGIPAIVQCAVKTWESRRHHESHVPAQQTMIQPQQQLLLSKLYYNAIRKSSYTCFTLWSICECISITYRV
jgi:hypothetical protein